MAVLILVLPDPRQSSFPALLANPMVSVNTFVQ